MLYLYTIMKLKDDVLKAVPLRDEGYLSLSEVAKELNLPVAVVQRGVNDITMAWRGCLVQEHAGTPPASITLPSRPIASEQVWPYTPLGDFVFPKDISKKHDALKYGYSLKEASVLLNTCTPAVKRCTRPEFAAGVDLSTEPHEIEARADLYYFRTRYTTDMPSSIDV